MDLKQIALKEKSIREIEARFKDKRDNLFEYIKYIYANELKKEFNE
jgi:hypothetical protein